MTRSHRSFAATAAACILGAILAFCSGVTLARQIHSERSLYRNILVTEEGSMRCLQFSVRKDQRNQSCVNLRHPKRMVFTYTRMMMASLLLQPDPHRILIVGLGGGTLPTALQEMYPDSQIVVVEIDPAVDEVARRYFHFRPTGNTRVVIQDARVFGKRLVRELSQHPGKEKKFDLILLDAFNGDYIPEHLMTREYLEETRGLMSDDGVLAANTFSISRLYDHESATYEAVFGPFLNLKSGVSANRIILASRAQLPGVVILKNRARKLNKRLKPYAVDLTEYVNRLSRRRDWDSLAKILTDQYAPANLLNAD